MKITAKTRDQLPPGQEPWSLEQVRKNLIAQHHHFKNHESGDPESKYAKLEDQMLAMCNIRMCTSRDQKGSWFQKKTRKKASPGVPDILLQWHEGVEMQEWI